MPQLCVQGVQQNRMNLFEAGHAKLSLRSSATDRTRVNETPKDSSVLEELMKMRHCAL